MRTWRRRGRAALSAVVLAAALGVATPVPAAAAPPVLPEPNAHGITLRRWTEVAFDARLLDAAVLTDAVFNAGMRKEVRVRVHLPANYDAARATPYPVLYLLHGGGGDWEDWTSSGNVRQIVDQSAFEGIVVMPEGGLTGFYSDWYGLTDGGFRPSWETFHVQQLVPWVDANFNTTGTRDGRAIAGLSMGGYGALRYAGRYPATFSAVGSFSGGTRMTNPGLQSIVTGAAWQAGAAIGNQVLFNHGLFDGNYRVNRKLTNGQIDPNECNQRAYRNQVYFGPPATLGAVDPYAMASTYNQYDGRMAVYAGDGGDPGYSFVDSPDCVVPATDERLIGDTNRQFHAELDRVGVQHRWCHGDGQHDWEDWQAELANFLSYVYGTGTVTCPNGWPSPAD